MLEGERGSTLTWLLSATIQWEQVNYSKQVEAHSVCTTFRELSAECHPNGKQQEPMQELLILSSFKREPCESLAGIRPGSLAAELTFTKVEGEKSSAKVIFP